LELRSIVDIHMAPQMMVLTLTHEVTFEPCTHSQIERDADYELVDGL
jgi:hypothetical protein